MYENTTPGDKFQEATQPAPDAPMVEWALWLAGHGLYVFPLHTPIFDKEGRCTGCTCEHYRRSDECKANHPTLYLGPAGKCEGPGKCPRVKWREKSTRDPAQLRKWFGKPWRNVDVETGRTVWLYPNIGIDCGKSGLIVVDLDTYKAHYAGDDLQLDEQTITTVTGGGGRHLWYAMPAGKAYGNQAGELPAGIDIRGAGGYIVAPASRHRSGCRYAFRPGHELGQVAIQTMPPALQAILDAAPGNRRGDVGPSDIEAVSQSAALVEAVLDHAGLSHSGAQTWGQGRRWVLHDCPFNPPDDPHGRDSAAFVVVLPDGAIGAGCHHNRCQKRIQAHGSGWGLLKELVGYQPTIPDFAPEGWTVDQVVTVAREWVLGPSCVNTLRAAGVRRIADYLKTLDALLDLATQRGTLRPRFDLRTLAELAGISHETARKHLNLLSGLRPGGAALVEIEENDYGRTVLLRFALDVIAKVDMRSPPNEYLVNLSDHNVGASFYSEHRADDAFTSYPYSFAIRRREAPTVLADNLNSTALLVGHVLINAAGPITCDEIAAASGLSPGAVAGALRKFKRLAMLVIWQERRRAPAYYELHPNFEERLDELRPEMKSFGVGALRSYRNANARAAYAEDQLRRPTRKSLRQFNRLEKRRDEAEALAQVWAQTLAAAGIDPHAKVCDRTVGESKEQQRRRRLTRAYLAGERALYRPKTEPNTEVARWRRRYYSAVRPLAERDWREFSAWAYVRYGPGWWVRLDITDVLGQYKLFEMDQDYVPPIHWAGDSTELAAAAD